GGADSPRVGIERHAGWLARNGLHSALCRCWRAAGPAGGPVEPFADSFGGGVVLEFDDGLVGVDAELLAAFRSSARGGCWRGDVCAGLDVAHRRSLSGTAAG